MTMRREEIIEMLSDPISWQTRNAIHNLRKFLIKLNIKSAMPTKPKYVRTGSRAVIKMNGEQIGYAEGVMYDYSDIRDIVGYGSDD